MCEGAGAAPVSVGYVSTPGSSGEPHLAVVIPSLGIQLYNADSFSLVATRVVPAGMGALGAASPVEHRQSGDILCVSDDGTSLTVWPSDSKSTSARRVALPKAAASARASAIACIRCSPDVLVFSQTGKLSRLSAAALRKAAAAPPPRARGGNRKRKSRGGGNRRAVPGSSDGPPEGLLSCHAFDAADDRSAFGVSVTSGKGNGDSTNQLFLYEIPREGTNVKLLQTVSLSELLGTDTPMRCATAAIEATGDLVVVVAWGAQPKGGRNKAKQGGARWAVLRFAALRANTVGARPDSSGRLRVALSSAPRVSLQGYVGIPPNTVPRAVCFLGRRVVCFVNTGLGADSPLYVRAFDTTYGAQRWSESYDGNGRLLAIAAPPLPPLRSANASRETLNGPVDVGVAFDRGVFALRPPEGLFSSGGISLASALGSGSDSKGSDPVSIPALGTFMRCLVASEGDESKCLSAWDRESGAEPPKKRSRKASRKTSRAVAAVKALIQAAGASPKDPRFKRCLEEAALVQEDSGDSSELSAAVSDALLVGCLEGEPEWRPIVALVARGSVSSHLAPKLFECLLSTLGGSDAKGFETCVSILEDAIRTVPEYDEATLVRTAECALQRQNRMKSAPSGDSVSPEDRALLAVVAAPANPLFLREAMRGLSEPAAVALLHYLIVWIEMHNEAGERAMRSAAGQTSISDSKGASSQATTKLPTFSQAAEWLGALIDAQLLVLGGTAQGRALAQRFISKMSAGFPVGEAAQVAEAIKGLVQKTIPRPLDQVPRYSIEVLQL